MSASLGTAAVDSKQSHAAAEKVDNLAAGARWLAKVQLPSDSVEADEGTFVGAALNRVDSRLEQEMAASVAFPVEVGVSFATTAALTESSVSGVNGWDQTGTADARKMND